MTKPDLNISTLTHDIFVRNNLEPPNPAIVHDILKDLQSIQPQLDTPELFQELITQLQIQFRYVLPGEEQVDLDEFYPYRAHPNYRRTKEGD